MSLAFRCCACTSRRYVSGETLVVDGAAWIYRPQLVARNMVSRLSRQVEGRSRKVGTAAGGGGRSGGVARSKL